MEKRNGFPIFVAGIGIGVAVTLLVKDGQLRAHLVKALGNGSQRATDALSDPQATWSRGEKAMSDIKDKLKDKIDDTAEGAKKVVDKVAEKSKDTAHKAGEQLEKTGKRLQKA